MCVAASVHFWWCLFAYKDPHDRKNLNTRSPFQNTPRSAAAVDPRSGGSRSSSRHPAGEGNRHRRSSSSPLGAEALPGNMVVWQKKLLFSQKSLVYLTLGALLSVSYQLPCCSECTPYSCVLAVVTVLLLFNHRDMVSVTSLDPSKCASHLNSWEKMDECMLYPISFVRNCVLWCNPASCPMLLFQVPSSPMEKHYKLTAMGWANWPNSPTPAQFADAANAIHTVCDIRCHLTRFRIPPNYIASPPCNTSKWHMICMLDEFRQSILPHHASHSI
jgi:hypothetical protein